MRKSILAAIALSLAVVGSASAADLYTKAPPAPPPPWWTGFYVGLNGGYSWGHANTNVGFFTSPGGVPIVPPVGSVTSAGYSVNGGVFGGQLGYNWQSGSSFVLGIETDIQWSGERGSANFLCAATANGGPCLPGLTFLPAGATGSALALQTELQWFGTLRGRAGVLVTPTWLAYVTGGLAYGSIETNTALAGFTPGGVAVAAAASNSTIRAGWTIGVGLEGQIAPQWTAKAEYLYMDLGSVSGTIVNTPAGIAANYSTSFTDNIFRVGINYQFR